MDKKVCIIGCAPSKNEVDWNQENTEYWGVNNLHVTEKEKPFSRWFEIHPIQYDPASNLWTRRWKPEFRGQSVNDYIKSLASLSCPVYMQVQWPQIPNSVRYPIEEIIMNYGRYFTNSISYQLALAMHEGFTEIQVFGVDMAVGSEYTHQRASCEFFLGLAAGKGIKVVVPNTSDLLKNRFMYAYEEKQEAMFIQKCKSVLENLGKQKNEIQGRLSVDERKLHQIIGAENAVLEMDKIWSNLEGAPFEEARC